MIRQKPSSERTETQRDYRRSPTTRGHGVVWLANARLVDVASGQALPRHVQVTGTRIAAISRTRQAHSDERVVDLSGAYLLPGFFDCHVHICVDSHNPNLSEGWSSALP